MSPGPRLWRMAGVLADRGGAAAVEFAIVLSLLALLVLGLADYGTGMWEKMMVGNAARAGAYYAAVSGYSQANIEAAVTGATQLGSTTACPPLVNNSVSACPAPSQACYCPTSTGLVASTGTPPACNTTLCSDGVTPAGYYVQVNAQALYSPLIRINGILGFNSGSTAITLQATYYARLN